jgi:hypothetical protein
MAATINQPPIHDRFDSVCHFFDDTPKNCIKSLRYTAEWAAVFFKNLGNYPEITRLLTALRHGTAIFIWPEFFKDINIFRLRAYNWIQGKTTDLLNVGLALGDAINKISDLGKWLSDIKVLTISASIASKIGFISGLTLMIGCANKIYKTLQEIEGCDYTQRPIKLWKLAKNTALFAIGFFTSLASVTSFFNPLIMLTLATTNLVASYGCFDEENPIETTQWKFA